MTLSRRTLLIGAGSLAALVASFAAGRYSRGVEKTTISKAEVHSEIVYASHASTTSTDRGRVRVVTVTKREPTGAVQTTRTEERANDLQLHSTWAGTESNRASETAEAMTVTRPTSADWRVGLSALWPVDRLALKPGAYTVELDRRVLGPFSVGVRGRYVPDDPKRSEAGAAISLDW